MDIDSIFINKAIKLALQALEKGEVPIGAIIVENNKIISKGINQVELLNDSTAHAEMIALSSAFAYKSSKYLPECTLYSTLKPCGMCYEACKLAHIEKIIYAIDAKQKVNNIFNLESFQIASQPSREFYGDIIKNFFTNLRIK